MKTRNMIRMAALLARVGLGLWFIYSGAIKVFVSGLDRFTRDVANYRLVEAPLDAIAAYTVPWFELVAGACLVFGVLRRGAILTLVGLVGVFAFCIAWAWAHQLDITCGCHGGDAPIHYWNKFAEFAAYLLVLGGLWWSEQRLPRSVGVPPTRHKTQDTRHKTARSKKQD